MNCTICFQEKNDTVSFIHNKDDITMATLKNAAPTAKFVDFTVSDSTIDGMVQAAKAARYSSAYGGSSPNLQTMPATVRHGDIDRQPDCQGWWVYVQIDPDTGDIVSARPLCVISPTKFVWTGEPLSSAHEIQSLVSDDSAAYVFLW